MHYVDKGVGQFWKRLALIAAMKQGRVKQLVKHEVIKASPFQNCLIARYVKY